VRRAARHPHNPCACRPSGPLRRHDAERLSVPPGS
jgi:hypothetical protein